jgi:poly(3-hydroxybutyrate) depolymerase
VHTNTSSTTTGRHGAYYLPPHHESGALPLLIVLHGTGGKGADILVRLRTIAERERFIVIAPDSASITGAWLVEQRSDTATEDYRHVMDCVHEVLALPGVQIDRTHVLIAGFSIGSGLAFSIASREDLFTAFAILHGHVVTDAAGPRRVRGWLSTGDRDRLRTVENMRSTADHMMRVAGFQDIETRVFTVDHALSEAELSGLVDWWLQRPSSRGRPSLTAVPPDHDHRSFRSATWDGRSSSPGSASRFSGKTRPRSGAPR